MKGRRAICCRRAVRGPRLPGEHVAYGSIHRIVQRFEQCHGFNPIDIVHHASPLLIAGNSQELPPSFIGDSGSEDGVRCIVKIGVRIDAEGYAP